MEKNIKLILFVSRNYVSTKVSIENIKNISLMKPKYNDLINLLIT